jgi:hypothetical protein
VGQTLLAGAFDEFVNGLPSPARRSLEAQKRRGFRFRKVEPRTGSIFET